MICQKEPNLRWRGHHHSIDGLTPELLERTAIDNAAPFYLLNGTELLRDVKKGETITLDDVDLTQLETYQLYIEGLGYCSQESL